jgi:uncharacterized membrane protein (DUF441 family)
MGNILKEIKKQAVDGILGNLPAIISGVAVLAGAGVEKLPIKGVPGAITKKLMRGTIAGVALAVTRAVATPAIPGKH